MMAMAMIQGAVLTAGSGQAGGREMGERERERVGEKRVRELGVGGRDGKRENELGTYIPQIKTAGSLRAVIHARPFTTSFYLHLKNSTCRSRKGLALGVNGFGFSLAATKYRKVHTPTDPSQRTDSEPVACSTKNE